MAENFVREDDAEAQRLRRIVLFGRNVASYKFALSKSLLELAAEQIEEVPLERLAIPFSMHLCEHLKGCDRQGTFQNSRFLDACRFYNAGRITQDELISMTVLRGFQNVIDAFHIVGPGEVGTRFFVDERLTPIRGIRLTDAMMRIGADAAAAADLTGESEARWRLVETAWEASASGQMVRILYDSPRELLVPALLGERRPVSEVRPALNGYQKGYCFYCFAPITLLPGVAEMGSDVDHFLPHSLMARGCPIDLDHVWNLVLACRECNRGASGKFASLPHEQYLARLHLRNEWFINSHHPLRETVIILTGESEAARMTFLRSALDTARSILPQQHGWVAPRTLEIRF